MTGDARSADTARSLQKPATLVGAAWLGWLRVVCSVCATFFLTMFSHHQHTDKGGCNTTHRQAHLEELHYERLRTRSFIRRTRCYELVVSADSRTSSQSHFACSHAIAAVWMMHCVCACVRNRHVRYSFYDLNIHATSNGYCPVSLGCRFGSEVRVPGHRHGREE